MAAPLVTAIANKAGRTIFRKAGKFISESQFKRESSILGTAAKTVARFKSAGSPAQINLAARLMNEIGPPIGGGTWESRVKKSTEHFIDILGEGGLA